MELKFGVENVKCGGCARSIEKALRADVRELRRGQAFGLKPSYRFCELSGKR